MATPRGIFSFSFYVYQNVCDKPAIYFEVKLKPKPIRLFDLGKLVEIAT